MPRKPRTDPDRYCECGGVRVRTRDGFRDWCDRCAELDGATSGQRLVISELRLRDMATVPEIADELGRDRSGIFKVLQRLEQAGKVRAYPNRDRGVPTSWRLTVGG